MTLSVPHRQGDQNETTSVHKIYRRYGNYMGCQGWAAQQITGVPRVGVLYQPSQALGTRAADKFREGMRLLGWIEGGTVLIKSRFTGGLPFLSIRSSRVRNSQIYRSNNPQNSSLSSISKPPRRSA